MTTTETPADTTPTFTPEVGCVLAQVTDRTPDYLEFGNYRGWVLLDEIGTFLTEMTDDEVRLARQRDDIRLERVPDAFIGEYGDYLVVWPA